MQSLFGGWGDGSMALGVVVTSRRERFYCCGGRRQLGDVSSCGGVCSIFSMWLYARADAAK